MESFGFHAIVVDGHDVEEVAKAFDEVSIVKSHALSTRYRCSKSDPFYLTFNEM